MSVQIGKWRGVQICVVCKRAGKITMTKTVMEIIDHINKEHEVKK